MGYRRFVEAIESKFGDDGGLGRPKEAEKKREAYQIESDGQLATIQKGRMKLSLVNTDMGWKVEMRDLEQSSPDTTKLKKRHASQLKLLALAKRVEEGEFETLDQAMSEFRRKMTEE